jgi:hypothetical protein
VRLRSRFALDGRTELVEGLDRLGHREVVHDYRDDIPLLGIDRDPDVGLVPHVEAYISLLASWAPIVARGGGVQ